MVVHHMDGAFELCIESPISILLTAPIVTFPNVSPRVSSAAYLSLRELSSSWLTQFLPSGCDNFRLKLVFYCFTGGDGGASLAGVRYKTTSSLSILGS